MGKNQKALEYFSQSLTLSRAVGDRNGVLKVASPIYKQNFSLLTGECLDDETVKIPTFPVRVVDDVVQVAVRKIAAFAWRSEAIALSVCSDIRYKIKPGFVFTNTIWRIICNEIILCPLGSSDILYLVLQVKGKI